MTKRLFLRRLVASAAALVLLSGFIAVAVIDMNNMREAEKRDYQRIYQKVEHYCGHAAAVGFDDTAKHDSTSIKLAREYIKNCLTKDPQ